MSRTIKTYEEWMFNLAGNEDLPAINVDKVARKNPFKIDPEAEKTLIFDEDDEMEYPNKIEDNTHGLQSHAIKHLYEFRPKSFIQYIEKSKDILMHYIDEEMKIVNKSGEIEYDINDDEDIEELSLYNIVNALDFINDKSFQHTQLSEVESQLLELVIRPIRVEYKRLIDHIFANAVRVEDYRKEMGDRPVYFTTFRGGRQGLNYYDPAIKGILATTMDKERVFSLFKIPRNTIFEYFNKLNPGSDKAKPNENTMRYLSTYGK